MTNSDSTAPVIIATCKEGMFGTDHRSNNDHKRGRRGHHVVRFAGNTLHPQDVEGIAAFQSSLDTVNSSLVPA